VKERERGNFPQECARGGGIPNFASAAQAAARRGRGLSLSLFCASGVGWGRCWRRGVSLTLSFIGTTGEWLVMSSRRMTPKL
jgi:hypothetical protein